MVCTFVASLTLAVIVVVVVVYCCCCCLLLLLFIVVVVCCCYCLLLLLFVVIVYSREDGDIPANAIIMGHTLTIPNPSVDDSGDYVCTSNAGMNEQDSFSVSLLVQPPPSTSTMQTTPTTTPTVLESAG